MSFTLTWEPQGVHRRYFGHVSAEERRRSFDRICGDHRFDDLRYALTDYLDVHSYEINDESTVEIAALHVAPLRTNPNIVIAAVVTDERIVAAIEHFIALGFTSQAYRIFPTRGAARAWIGHHLSSTPPALLQARR